MVEKRIISIEIENRKALVRDRRGRDERVIVRDVPLDELDKAMQPFYANILDEDAALGKKIAALQTVLQMENLPLSVIEETKKQLRELGIADTPEDEKT